MRIIQHPDIPTPAGHYSMCIEHNGLLYLAGQLPKHPKTGEIAAGIREQTQQTLENVLNIVTAAGSHLNQIIQMRIYISDIELWGEVNAVYSEFFGEHRPVRAVIPTRELHFGALIEIEAIAAVGSD
jgi:2-iminobutanoate/2-iminopropanoate deaminase